MPKPSASNHWSNEEALAFHATGKPGKLEIQATKPLTTARDLSLAYSPGVAVPCLAIKRDPALCYDYTARGNVVAVISNGTAVLGLGNLGALASKPVIQRGRSRRKKELWRSYRPNRISAPTTKPISPSTLRRKVSLTTPEVISWK